MGSVTNGHRVGRYELVQMLGEGGMGTVWLARPFDAPDQFYAVKMVSPQFAGDPQVCGMFVKEASLAAAIEHPNVVHLFDVGIHDDLPFFVMEWIDGYNLRDIVQRVNDSGERIPPSVALRIAADLCGGLHAAHELTGDDGQPLGLVHRDVSPHNVLITRYGVAKLIDFGVAKARDLMSNNDDSQIGGLKGKVRYMAPEQARERNIDRRADLFSVGAVTYELLTGRAPFEGPNEMAIINQLLSTSPVYVPENLPEPVQWILRRALARRPENRFGDAAEMQNAIELALVEMGAPDKHEDVAEVMAWFSPPDEDGQDNTQREHMPRGATTERRDGLQDLHDLRQSTPSPPPLAFSGPPANAMPMRRGSMLDPDEIDLQRKARARSGGPLKIVLIAAVVLGLLGAGAFMLLREPSRKDQADQQGWPDPVDTSTTTALTASVPTTNPTEAIPTPTTPIIDMGDLQPDQQPEKKKPRRKAKPAPTADSSGSGAATLPTDRGSTTGDKAAPAPKGGDLAGPVKVWK